LIGVIAGLFDAGLDVTEADLIIGTSAGSTAAAQITGATPTELLAVIDGGYRRNENADLAAGYERVLVLSPFGGRSLHPPDWGMQLAAQVDELHARGSRVETIFPDSNSEHMFGANAMDQSLRPPAARAGYSQGRALAGRLTQFWR